MLQAETISHHRDEFAVGRFCFRVGNRVAEQGGNGIDIAPVPGYFNGVMDSSKDLKILFMFLFIGVLVGIVSKSLSVNCVSFLLYNM